MSKTEHCHITLEDVKKKNGWKRTFPRGRFYVVTHSRQCLGPISYYPNMLSFESANKSAQEYSLGDSVDSLLVVVYDGSNDEPLSIFGEGKKIAGE